MIETKYFFCRIRPALYIFLFTFLSSNLSAQNGQDKLGNWLMYFGSNKISQKLSIHSEVQYRNHTVVPLTVEQLLLRTGLNYHINKSSIATIGYGYIAGHTFESIQKEPESEEHRVFQQFILTNQVGRVKFEHRYRLEQRWSSSNYRNRFRYRLMLFVSLNKPKIEKNTWFLGLYDEVFVNSKNTFFDRNRLYGALGYQLNKRTNVQAGMMYQQVNDFGKWHLQFSVSFNPDLRKSK